MTENHPITPPPALVKQWWEEADKQLSPYRDYIATQAARWGADEELQACINWLYENDWKAVYKHLRDARRPKPPSLKEQALTELNLTADPEGAELSRTQVELIRRALESLPD